MKTIKVVSSSRVDNSATYELIREMIEKRGLEVRLEKARIVAGIQGVGVMEAVGVFIDGEQVHDGAPDRSEIEGWLVEIEKEPCCGFCGGQGQDYLKSLRQKANPAAR
jgi:hypothetical protein